MTMEIPNQIDFDVATGAGYGCEGSMNFGLNWIEKLMIMSLKQGRSYNFNWGEGQGGAMENIYMT